MELRNWEGGASNERTQELGNVAKPRTLERNQKMRQELWEEQYKQYKETRDFGKGNMRKKRLPKKELKGGRDLGQRILKASGT